jgi:IS30 family transposase
MSTVNKEVNMARKVTIETVIRKHLKKDAAEELLKQIDELIKAKVSPNTIIKMISTSLAINVDEEVIRADQVSLAYGSSRRLK